MKKLSTVFLVVFLVMTFSAGAFAAVASDWTNVGAGSDTFTVDGTSIKIVSNGGYDANNNGILYKHALDLNSGITFEFSIDQFPAAGNAWFGPSILNKNAYFNVADAGKGEGFVFLIWPTGACQVYGISKTAPTAFQTIYTFWLPEDLVKEYKGKTIKMSLKTDDKLGIKVLVNDKEVEVDGAVNAADYLNLFKGNDAYFAFSTSDLGESEQISHIISLNGKPAAETEAASEKAGAAPEQANPKTGDAGILIPALGAGVSALSVITLAGVRRKHKTGNKR